MTDLTHVIRWNTNFVRGLAQSVLDRAKVVRTSLTNTYQEAETTAVAAVKAATQKSTGKPAKTVGKAKGTAKKATTKRTARKPARSKKNS